MGSLVFKWLIVFACVASGNGFHPIFVSVTEIGLNAASKTLEISCKIFTNDFETTLRQKYHTKIDLLDAKLKASMNPVVNDYIKKHLSIITDGKPASLEFLGFEQEEEGIISYYEVKNVATVKKLEVSDNILYEFNSQQMEIIHVMVNGARKSSRLNNPDEKVSFEF